MSPQRQELRQFLRPQCRRPDFRRERARPQQSAWRAAGSPAQRRRASWHFGFAQKEKNRKTPMQWHKQLRTETGTSWVVNSWLKEYIRPESALASSLLRHLRVSSTFAMRKHFL